MTPALGHYKDFFAHDIANYKVLYSNNTGKVFQNVFQNGSLNHTDTFVTIKPSKLFYPKDTLGVFLSLSAPSSGFNTIIQRYTPINGYSTVFQDQSQKLSDIYFPSTHYGYVVGDAGLVLRTIDSASSWQPISTGFSQKLNSVFFINDSTGFAVGDAGLILKTNNYGVTWQQQAFAYTGNMTKVYFVNDLVGFAHAGISIYRTTNGGALWINEPTSVSNTTFLYPNPSDNYFSFSKSMNNSEELIQFTIVDLEGKTIIKDAVYPEQQFEHSLQTGVYVVIYTINGETFKDKLVAY